jgi:hypothetical protein
MSTINQYTIELKPSGWLNNIKFSVTAQTYRSTDVFVIIYAIPALF